MHIIRLFFIFVTHQFISCFRFTLKAILLGGWKIFKNFWRWETCRRAWVFLQDYMHHYDISFFLVFWNQQMMNWWYIVNTWHITDSVWNTSITDYKYWRCSNKQTAIYGLIVGHWQVLVCLDGCWSTPIDLLHHHHHTSPLLVEEGIMQDCATPYHPKYTV